LKGIFVLLARQDPPRRAGRKVESPWRLCGLASNKTFEICTLAKKERRKELTPWRPTFRWEEQKTNSLAALRLSEQYNF
jgi:hypothetical protein